MAFFPTSSMVLGLLNQLQIFLQLYLIELLLLLITGLGLHRLLYLIYPRLLTGFGMLFSFTNLSPMEFLFSVIDGFQWFSTGSLHHNIQLMLEFLKAPFLFLYFSYYTLMTFLMMLSMILLPMLMILLSILSVISIWSVATTWIGFWICIWSTRHFLHYLYC